MLFWVRFIVRHDIAGEKENGQLKNHKTTQKNHPPFCGSENENESFSVFVLSIGLLSSFNG